MMNNEQASECTHDCASCSSACLSKFINTEVLTESGLSEAQAAGSLKEGETTAFESCILAIDLGTTTIAMQLIGRESRRIYDTYTCLNPQLKFGADVISRVAAAKEHADELQRLVMSTIKTGIDRLLSKFSPNDIKQKVYITLAGNTVMTHILLGWDAGGLGEAPFTPVSLEASEIEMGGYTVHTLPMISAFVGGDIYAGLLAARLKDGEMLVDLGTNGEIALLSEDRLYVTATAAGPAFARPGDELMATDRISLVSELLNRGLLDRGGYLHDEGESSLTQKDVQDMMLAKGAIAAGIEVLCKKSGRYTEDDNAVNITKIYLSGGFGYRLSPQAAVNIGLLPHMANGCIKAIGNSSLYGAYLYGCGNRIQNYSEITSVNLAMTEEFTPSFYKHMILGQTEEDAEK